MEMGVADIGHSVRFRTIIPYTVNVFQREAKEDKNKICSFIKGFSEISYLCICSSLKSNVNGTDTGFFQFS
jgi:hypothetical protein